MIKEEEKKETWPNKRYSGFEKLPDDCEDVEGGYFLRPGKDDNGKYIKYNGEIIKYKTFDVCNKYGLRTKYKKENWNKEFRETPPEVNKEF